MSIEGGAFKCPITGFETMEIPEWNKHCMEDCDKHGESGSTVCISCGAGIEYQHIPYRPLAPDGSKGIALQCENCMSAMMGKGSVKSAAKAKDSKK
jgi:hypothetical protein